MRTKCCLSVVLSLFGSLSCSKASISPQDLLVVVASASDVERSPNTVSYRVNEAFPAPDATKALIAAAAAKSCALLSDDPFNPPPGFTFGAWDEQKLQNGGTAKIWFGGWQCSGGVVVFSVISERDGEPVKVKGAYYTDEQMKEIRKTTHAGR